MKATKIEDLDKVAKCHRNAFPYSLATALGHSYCKRMISWYLSSPNTFIFHLESVDGICIGYCGGMINNGRVGTGSASGMAQHTFNSAIWGLITHPTAIFHPEIRAKLPFLLKNLRMKIGLEKKVHFSPAQKQQMQLEPKVGLVAIGVDPSFQGKGYGSVLLQEFERRSLEQYGINKLQLSVLPDNKQAIKAYEHNGWIISETSTSSIIMTKICK